MYHFFIADTQTLFARGLELILSNLFMGSSFSQASKIDDIFETQENDQRFEMIILGFSTVQKDGFYSLKKINETYPFTPIVIFCDEPTIDDVQNIIKNGAKGAILKSSSEETLKSALTLIFAGETFLPREPFMASQQASTYRPQSPKSAFGSGNPLSHLTRRQYDVLILMMKGQSNKEVALSLGLFENTIKAHVKAILKKLEATNRTQAVVKAASLGMSGHYE